MPRFKLNTGQHISETGKLYRGTRPDGKGGVIEGDVIETNYDLNAFNGPPGYSQKFTQLVDYRDETPENAITRLQAEMDQRRAEITEREKKRAEVHAATAPTPQPQIPQPAPRHSPNFDAMSVKELQQWAAEEEVDLKGATSKDTILRVLRLVKT